MRVVELAFFWIGKYLIGVLKLLEGCRRGVRVLVGVELEGEAAISGSNLFLRAIAGDV